MSKMRKVVSQVMSNGHDTPRPPTLILSRSDTTALIATLLSFFFLISPAAFASATQPEEVHAAIIYFQKLKENKVELTQDTALSEHCSPTRRQKIKEQIQFFSETHLHPNDTFSLEKTKVLGNLAAVLLKTQNSRTPLSIRIHAVALIRRNQKWSAAPVPGSFSNTGYGYDPTVEKNVILLENWMARQKVIRESQARKTAEENLIHTIKKEETKAKLTTLNQQQTISYFIQQCRQKKLLGVLASLGAGSGKLSDSLEAMAKNISAGLGGTDPDNTWQLVSNPSVIVHAMGKTPKSQEMAMGFWNPLNKQHIHFLHFPISSSEEKKWVKLPHPLTIAMLPQQERWKLRWQHHHANENELKKKLVSTLFKEIPRLKFPDTPKNLSNSFLEALETRDFTHAFKLLPNQGKYLGEHNHQKETLTELSKLWKNLYSLKNTPHQNLPLIIENTLALLPLQYANPNNPGKFDTVKVWFFKDSNGWHLIPEETISALKDSSLKSQKKALNSSMLTIVKKRQDAFSKKLLSKVTFLTPPLELPAPNDRIAQDLLTRFRIFLRSKETVSALSQCAILKGTSNTQTLKTFNYALNGAADQFPDNYILNTNQSGPWTSISLRTQSKTSKVYDYPFYLIVTTSNGPKILLDIDLRYATNKGRKLLNGRNWKKLERALPAPSLAHLKTLFAKHETVSKSDIDSHEE